MELVDGKLAEMWKEISQRPAGVDDASPIKAVDMSESLESVSEEDSDSSPDSPNKKGTGRFNSKDLEHYKASV